MGVLVASLGGVASGDAAGRDGGTPRGSTDGMPAPLGTAVLILGPAGSLRGPGGGVDGTVG